MNKQDIKDRYSANKPQPDQTAKHDKLAREMAAYEAEGGKVEHLDYLVFGQSHEFKHGQVT